MREVWGRRGRYGKEFPDSGPTGLRDLGLLEAADAQPINKSQHGTTDLFEPGAAYAVGIAKAQAFIDGNQRAALVCALPFLLSDGVQARLGTDDTVHAIEDVARDG